MIEPDILQAIRGESKRQMEQFFKFRDVIVIVFPDNPIKLIGVDLASRPNTDMDILAEDIRRSLKKTLWRTDLFKSH